ncbi:MAG: hypothetical protein Q4B01_06000 [Eubacteriales bacterium]|nr:hypothetical protein [Eubacteriales bacterium]
MYEQNSEWKEFYEELDPDRREKLLEELLASAADDGANAFRQQLFHKRYTDPKNPKHRIDLFLQQCIYLPVIYRKRKSFMVNVKKEMRLTLEALELKKAEDGSAAEQGVLYAEIRNAAERYFKTCSGSRYGSYLFGLSRAKEEDKERLAAKDAWMMAVGMPRAANLEKEMQLFSDAVHDAFCARYVSGEELMRDVEETLKENGRI